MEKTVLDQTIHTAYAVSTSTKYQTLKDSVF